MSSPLITKKRSVTLIEVLIAIFLVSICFVPLLAPHKTMIQTQKNFIKKVELDRTINLLYGQILYLLYENKIDWSAIQQKTRFPITADLLESLSIRDPFPYQGSYFFEIIDWKPKIKADEVNPVNPDYYVILLKLTFLIKEFDDKEKQYTYDISLIQRVSKTAPIPKEE